VVDPFQHCNKFRVLYCKIRNADVKVNYRVRNCGKNLRRNLILGAKILHVYRNRVLSRFYVQQFPVKISRGFEMISIYLTGHFVYKFL
jgi:hypothetical protein